MAINLVPASEQDYSSQKKVLEAFRAGDNFILAQPGSPWTGELIGRTQVEELREDTVHIQYSSLTRIVTLKQNDETGKWEID